ncbi:phage portal protein [Corynebacterium lipophiloflavum]|uniref:phage portal protein n=1 Tax=Corynebacterium lipophiloflavum TaxID=161889 RepID=UPI001FDF3EAE|nr:phage portal protein [Corynebacterium lipophiloflavum]
MGIFSRLFGRFDEAAAILGNADNEYMFAAPIFATLARDVDKLGPAELYSSQPHLRTVVTYIAEQIAAVSLHTFERMPDGGRERVRIGDAAEWQPGDPLDADRPGLLPLLMQRPNRHQLMQDMLRASILDYLLFDEFMWAVLDTPDETPEIVRIPISWIIGRNYEDPWTLKAIRIRDNRGHIREYIGDRLIHVHGYNPEFEEIGVSPVDSLKETLREQLQAASYRAELWRNGPRLGGVITRPPEKDVGKWSPEGRRRFKTSLAQQYSSGGSNAGGTMVLEDGMKFEPQHLNAKDEQLPEMTKLSLSTVAQVYHVNPTMVGLLDNANYSNVQAFRQSLYVDSLGPLIKQIEGTLNSFVLPMLGIDESRYYVEFNLEEKLRGNFEEQADMQTSAAGGPWMTINEVRAMRNLPALEGGDDLIRPLNVTTAPTAIDEENQDTPPDIDPAPGGDGE